MELVVRYIVLQTLEDPINLRKTDVGSLLADRLLEIAAANYDIENEGKRFRRTFAILENALQDNAFRRFDVRRERFAGASLVSSFEVMGIGLGHFVDAWSDDDSDKSIIETIAKSIWSNPRFTQHQGSGVSCADRIPYTIPLGRDLFRR